MASKQNRSRQRRKSTQRRNSTRRNSTAPRYSRDIALAVLDHESCELARKLFPQSFGWDSPDEYLDTLEHTAKEIAKSGDRPIYVFIDLDDYIAWCEDTGSPIDSTESRATYAAICSYDGIPYHRKQRLWSLSVLSMAYSSEVWPDDEDEDEDKDFIVQFIDQLTDFVLASEGTYRIVATAARLYDCGKTVLWQHFRHAITSQVVFTHCSECLSIIDTMQWEQKMLTVANYGNISPLDAVLRLATYGHGVVGIEARNGEEFTFRAFEIDRDGWRPVPADVLGNRLGTPDAPSLRCGFDRQEFDQ